MRQGRWDILARLAALRRRTARHRARRRVQQPQRREARASRSTCAPSAGAQLLRELVAVSDVVTENFAAGVLAGLGFSLRRRCRRSSPTSSTCRTAGSATPARTPATRRGGPIVQAVCGLTFSLGPARPAARRVGLLVHGPPGRQLHGPRDPRRAGPPQPHRRGPVGRHGVHRGRRSPWPGPTCSTTRSTAGRCAAPGMPDSNRSHSPAMAPHGIYPAAATTRWVAIACRDDDDWARAGRGHRRAVGRRRALGDAGRSPGRRGRARPPRGARGPTRASAFAIADRAAGRRRPGGAVAPPEERIDHDPDTQRWGLWPTVAPPRDGRRARRRRCRCTCRRPTGASSGARRARRAQRRRLRRAARAAATTSSTQLAKDGCACERAALPGRAGGRSPGCAWSSWPASTPRSPASCSPTWAPTWSWSSRPAATSAAPTGPFVDDEPDPERSLWWWHYNTSKRGVVLDLDDRGRPGRLPALVAGGRHRARGRAPGRWPRCGLDHDRSAGRASRADLGVGHAVRPRRHRAPTSRPPTSPCWPAVARCGAAATTTTRCPRCAAAATRRFHIASVVRGDGRPHRGAAPRRHAARASSST